MDVSAQEGDGPNMNRTIATFGIGTVVFLLWYFVALEVVWVRDGMSISLGLSLGLNASLLFWLASAPSRRRSVHVGQFPT